MTSPLLFSNSHLPAGYDLEFSIDALKPNFKAQSIIHLAPNDKFNNSESSAFNLSLNTQSIISLSAAAILQSGERQKLQISLNKTNQTTDYSFGKPLDAKAIEITYLGQIETILKYEDVTKGLFKIQYMNPLTGQNDLHIWSTHTQPNFGSKLFPCIDEISLKVPFNLTLKLDKKFDVVANSAIQSEDVDGNTKTCVFKQTLPIPTSLFAFRFGDLEMIEHKATKIPLRVFTQVGESHRSRFAMNTAIETLTKLSDAFGMDLPLEKLDFIALPFLSDGAVENFGHISIINDAILTPGWQVSSNQLERSQKQIEDVVVHQFVHMYMGDLVTIDHWKYEWFNESFATFMANELLRRWESLSGENLQNVKLFQMDPEVGKVQQDLTTLPSRIHETFDKDAYEKGIWVLKLVMQLFESPQDFFTAVGEFIKANQFRTFKPIDLWKFLKDHELNKFKYDIATIVHSWTHLAGIPVIEVTKIETGYKLVQHRILFEPLDHEDVPVMIPINIRTKDGKFGRQLITDRSLVIAQDDLVSIQCDLAIVNYTRDQYKQIGQQWSQFTYIEQCQLVQDLNILLSCHYQSDDHIIGSLELIKGIKNVTKMSPWAMNSLITNYIQLAKMDSAKFTKLTTDLANKFIQQFQWDEFYELNQAELSIRSLVLSMQLENAHAQSIAKKMFKKLLHGPRNAIPKEFLVPLLSLVAFSSTVKEFKELTHIVKNPDTITNNTFTKSTVSQLATKNDIQLAALNSLGNVQSNDLINKVLNFVKSNIEYPMIEMALMSMEDYQSIWKWFKTNELVWWSKWQANHLSTIGRFFENVTKYLLDVAQRQGGDFQAEVENWALSKSQGDDKRIQYWVLESKEKPQEIKLTISDDVTSHL